MNREKFIQYAIESVLQQDVANFEHLIMDGCSSDKTLEIVGRYPHLWVYSENDNGMYDAINKGIEKSKGEIIGLLNSDDLYAAGIFPVIMHEFEKHPDIDVVSGAAAYFSDGDIEKKLAAFSAVNQNNILERVTTGVPIINAWFFRRRVFQKIGLFDQNFSIGADRDFQIRCMLDGVKIHPLEALFYYYRHHEGSMTITRDLARKQAYLDENLRIARKYSMLITDSRTKKQFLKWFRVNKFDSVIVKIRKQDFSGAGDLVLETARSEPGWLAFLLAYIPGRLLANFWRVCRELISTGKH